MDYAKIEKTARLMASKAKPGTMKLNDKVYTFEFDQRDWSYVVYENMEYFIRFNTKSLKTAKQWLIEYFNN